MSSSMTKLISASGQITCSICNIIIKSDKVWIAHVNSRKHLLNVKSNKTGSIHSNDQQVIADKKRLADEKTSVNDATMAKRTKYENEDATSSNDDNSDNDRIDVHPANVPDNFFDKPNVGDMPPPLAPWHAEAVRNRGTAAAAAAAADNQKIKKQSSNAAAAAIGTQLPEGFFDDPKLDQKVRNAPDPNIRIDAEYERFVKELDHEQQNLLESALEGDETEIFDREIEEIDAQLHDWTKVNELELKKDEMAAILQKAMSTNRAQPTDIKMDDDNDDTDSDVDINEKFSWRTKTVK